MLQILQQLSSLKSQIQLKPFTTVTQIIITSKSMDKLKVKANQRIYISSTGLKNILERQVDSRYPLKGILWTDDFRWQLPIKLTSQGVGSLQPQTLIDLFHRCLRENSKRPALSVKRNNKWETLTYQQYYQQALLFGRALIALGADDYTSVNIIGFNSPEWSIAFFGSIFARCLPTGVYTTNNIKTCEYVARNSDCKFVVAENFELAKKYMHLLDEGTLDIIVLYYDRGFKIPSKYERKIFHWNDFMTEGHRVQSKFIHYRMEKIKPGHCSTLIYTSGTTGMPKGVMLSHDNYTWTKKAMNEFHKRDDKIQRMVSFLPLSHVAAQFSDIISPLDQGLQVFFAGPDALQGGLIQTLQEVRPHVFFSVPRVWQKIYDKVQEMAQKSGSLVQSLATWAKSIGPQGTIKQYKKQQTDLCFKLAKVLVYSKFKKALGLDQCKYFLFGAAPLDPKIRQWLLSLNIFLINTYGMSQSTGPQNFSDIETFDWTKMSTFRQVGKNVPGTQQKIVKCTPLDEDGEICYRGRNVFMGYYKNPEETSKVIDQEGFLHSGDMGKFDKNGVLYITGRAKELIITAGGQNVPPLLIEHQVLCNAPFLSQVMVVGDQRKYLTCLIAIKQTEPGSKQIQATARNFLSLKGQQVTTVEQARNSKIVRKLIQEAIDKANQKAISRAQFVQAFHIIPEQFSVQNGLLTPTMKLKRKEVSKKYHAQIQSMYNTPKL